VHPFPHGYSHDTRGDGAVVHKRYQGPLAAERCSTERAVLSRLPATLPVPRLLAPPAAKSHLPAPPAAEGQLLAPPAAGGHLLVMAHLAGVHGQDLMQAGHTGAVLFSCGAMLRRLQREVDAAAVVPGAPPGSVLVHGDFGPNNMLFDPVTFAVTGLLDWEWAHPGDPVEDLAWCEWIVRRHHPGETGHLPRLFAGYGERAPWPRRQAAAVARCRQMLALVRTGPGAEHGERRWRENLALTQGWTEAP
jgi:hypothetical protein